MATELSLTKNSTSVIPRGIVEAKLKASQYQMDIIALLLAEIGKKSDIDDNLEYHLTVEQFAELKDLSNTHEACRVLRDYICGNTNNNDESMRHIGFELYIGENEFHHYNWFDKISYKDGIATFTLTPDIKKFLVDFKKNDKTRVYAKLRYVLPMKSVYSKRIYLMCRNFTTSGIRFCDTDWDVFKAKLQIPDSYRYLHIKKNVLDKAVEEINEISDITISYTISEKNVQRGKQPVAIRFYIQRKDVEEDYLNVEEQKDEVVQDIESMTDEEIKAQMERMAAILENRKGK